MVFRRPKEKEPRLTEHSPSSNLNWVQIRSKKSRRPAQHSKNLPIRSSLRPPRFPTSGGHVQCNSNIDNHLPLRPTHPGTPAKWPPVPATTVESQPLVLNLTESLQVSRQPLDQCQENFADISKQDAALCDLISSKFDAILTSIDGESFSGDERELGSRLHLCDKFPF